MKKTKKYFGFIFMPFFLCFTLICALFFYPASFETLNNLSYDIFQKLSAKGKNSDVAVIVDIDEKSLNDFGQWPWPRYILAALIEKLILNGASVVALDILLDQKDKSSPILIQKELNKYFGVSFDVNFLPPALRDNDEYFSQILQKYPVVLGTLANFNTTSNENQKKPKPISVITKSSKDAKKVQDSIKQVSSFIAPLEKFTAATGLINTNFSNDAVIRSVPLIAANGDKIYASLALRALMLKENKKSLRLDLDKDGASTLSFGKIKTSLNHDGSYNLLFSGAQHTYTYLSASDVLKNSISENSKNSISENSENSKAENSENSENSKAENSISENSENSSLENSENSTNLKEILKDKIVFIGSSAAGLMDIRSTPVAPQIAGVELHANIIDNLLNQKSIIAPAWAKGMQIMLIVILCIFCVFLFSFAPALLYLPLAIGVGSGICFASYKFFTNGFFISPSPILLAFFIFGLYILSFRFYLEESSKKQIKSVFSRYVSPQVIQKLLKSSDNLFLGEQKEVSILFSDIRDFTSISEKLSPNEMVRFLNSYFSPMSACVKNCEGTMDKFIGDALMAFWNAPLDVQNHPKKVLLCATTMQEKLRELKDEFKNSFGVEIKIGIGIHTGLVHVGNMGSDELLDYTCIGDNVNLASRLEGLCKYYDAEIIASGALAKRCDTKMRLLDKIKVKGKNEALEIYTPLRENEDPKMWLKALDFYFSGDFSDANTAFNELLKSEFYEKNAKIFLERLEFLSKNLPKNWDGIWEFQTK